MERSVKYSLVTDSHHRRFLREEGYGYIAQVFVHRTMDTIDVTVTRINKGVDMRLGTVESLAKAALNEYRKGRLSRNRKRPGKLGHWLDTDNGRIWVEQDEEGVSGEV
jgi:hypothetical protein